MGSQDKAFMKKVIGTLVSVVTLLAGIVGGFGVDLKNSVDDLREKNLACVRDRAEQAGRISSLEFRMQSKSERIKHLEDHFSIVSYEKKKVE
jgi:hypothetical protein